jgi:peptidoglycan/LPS O-acetylase OafA/YrhL
MYAEEVVRLPSDRRPSPYESLSPASAPTAGRLSPYQPYLPSGTPRPAPPRRRDLRPALQASARPGYRPDVEGLRGVSVLLVVAFHARLGPLAGGFVGVDVFFVISGFLITGLLVDELQATGTISLTGFYARRARRLLPLASLVLVATVLMFRPVLAPIDRPGLGTDVQAAAAWVANWYFAAASTDYLNSASPSPVLHYWSLSVEEQFYVLWPLLLLALAGSRRRWGTAVLRLAVGLAALGGVSLLLSAVTTGSDGPWAYFGLHTRAWEPAAGALLALARPTLAALPGTLAGPATWAGLAAIGVSGVGYDRDTTFPGLTAVLPVAGAVLVLAGGTVAAGHPADRRSGHRGHRRPPSRGLLTTPALTYVGRISYGWYLWHWPCLILARQLFDSPSTADADLAPGTPSTWPAMLAVLVSFGLADGSHRLVEQPLRRAQGLIRSAPRSLAVGAGLLVVAGLLPTFALDDPTDAGAAHVIVASAPTSSAPANPPPPSGSAATGSTTSGTFSLTITPTLTAPPVARLRQTPQQARADDAAPSRCFLGFAATTVDPTCRFGDADGTHVMVLFGDSHAAQWFPALLQAATANRWTLYFWAKSGCGYADTPQWLRSFKRIYTECETWRNRVLREVSALPRVDTVLVGRNYAQFSKMVDARHRALGAPEAARAWSEGARRTLTALGRRADDLVLLRDTPRPAGDAPACLSAQPDHPERCAYPRAGRVALDADVFAAEQSALAATGTDAVDLSDLVCATDPCSVVSPSGAIVFRDAHHLTATFAREIAPAVTQRLKQLIDGW